VHSLWVCIDCGIRLSALGSDSQIVAASLGQDRARIASYNRKDPVSVSSMPDCPIRFNEAVPQLKLQPQNENIAGKDSSAMLPEKPQPR
jgi:hypothetical protein